MLQSDAQAAPAAPAWKQCDAHVEFRGRYVLDRMALKILQLQLYT